MDSRRGRPLIPPAAYAGAEKFCMRAGMARQKPAAAHTDVRGYAGTKAGVSQRKPGEKSGRLF